MAVWYILGVIALLLPLVEVYVWWAGIWWHSEQPHDPRNGL